MMAPPPARREAQPRAHRPVGKHSATVASGATLLAHCKNHSTHRADWIFQGCSAPAGLAPAVVLKAGWGTTLLGCAFRLNQVVGLNSGITVIPAGSIA